METKEELTVILMLLMQNPGEYQEAVHTVSLAARSRHIPNFVSSAQKQETPKLRVDMEAKLRAWLESRGKTKSAQRSRALTSPVSMKKNVGYASSTSAKTGVKHGAFLPKRSQDSFLLVKITKLFLHLQGPLHHA